MKHPRAEIYLALESAFAKRNCPGFADELRAMTAAVVEGKDNAMVDAVAELLADAISVCEVKAAIGDPAVVSIVIENLIRTAGVEYQVGVIDGAIDNLHEYQDAWGFTQIAAQLSASSAFAGSSDLIAIAGQLQDKLAGLQDMWPSLNPTAPPGQQAARLFGAAGEIQLLTLRL